MQTSGCVDKISSTTLTKIVPILYLFYMYFLSYFFPIFFVFFLYFQDYFKVIFLPILNLLFWNKK